jgi:uncharacterized protein
MDIASQQQFQAKLVQALLKPECYAHPVQRIRLVETHISFVLLTGQYAYKIKKALDLGFLDFSDLQKRRFYCHEELRLNRRLAPTLYLDVVPVTGAVSTPRMGGPGEALEYALRMREFPEEAHFERMDARGELGPDHLDALAETVAQFHAHCAIAPSDSPWGEPEAVAQATAQNFSQIAALLVGQDQRARLERLQTWTSGQHGRLTEHFRARKRQGFVRECHGDLHLGNLAWYEGRPLVFDCIEFNPNLRWIDVVSEIAFLHMDLIKRGHPAWARRFLNRYLEFTGDYAGLAGLAYYAVYRALVRAKVSFIRSSQADIGPQGKARGKQEGKAFLDLAQRLAQPGKPMLLIAHGLSGSGKTYHTERVLEFMDVIRLRSDVERKRLFGLTLEAKTGAHIGGGIYGAEVTRKVYQHLRVLARELLTAGLSVIVDGTFIARWQRDLFRSLANELALPLRILDFSAPESILRQRIKDRHLAGRDASEADQAVLDHQLRTHEALTSEELALTIPIDSATAQDYRLLASGLAKPVEVN